ncbi:methyl-accepting chemotaxis protein [Paenibacillus frigoriresistens]|uniref:methyl-accepting chemotaxis protein n=1 Tax=Paenibacillus alginolyticus TaxID=59839 RepID=UPI0015659411|nr:HAMP domain-containing methyl-accepting chemotaxis protein [Paenibacillus frigoriresistens]NRF91644.1 methyl-accepting chemotaxis protein [Paenibacillus frigoriresistens]
MNQRFKIIKLTVGKKLYAGFIVILLLMCMLGLTTMNQLKSVNVKTKTITADRLPGIELINEINYLTEQVRSLELRTLIEPNQSLIGELNAQTQTAMEKIENAFQAYAKTIATDEEQVNFNSLKEEWDKYKSLHNQFIELSKKINLIYKGSGDKGDQLLQFLRDSQKVFDNMQINVNFLVKINHDGSIKAGEESQQVYHSGIITSLVFIIISLIISMILAYFITRNISNPVRLVSRVLEQVASGDLRIKAMKVKNRDEIGNLVNSLNQMVGNLQSIVIRIQQASITVASSSEDLSGSSEETSLSTEQITTAMQEVAAGAENQMMGFAETSKAMEEMSKGIQYIAEASSNASDLAIETTKGAIQGNEMIHLAIHRMNAVNDIVQKSAAELIQLNDRSIEIGGIVKMITEIASQTHLLALNASIEAARAGELGRGFSVVAAEVKKLAEESERSAQQIQELIRSIQTDTSRAVLSMNEGVSEIHDGMKSVSLAGAAFEEIVGASDSLSIQIQEIASSSEQMSASSEQVTASVLEMNHISKKSYSHTQNVAETSIGQLASMQEITASSNSLTVVAQELQQVISMFKIDKE